MGLRQTTLWNGKIERKLFLDPAEVERDMTNCPLWQKLVGNAVEILEKRMSNQIIEIRSANSCLDCCSREGENRWSDVIQITNIKPEEPV